MKRFIFILALFAASVPAFAQTAPAISIAPVAATPPVATTTALPVTVTVAGTPAPTGSVTILAQQMDLVSGTLSGYTTPPTTLANGSATVLIPAGLATGAMTVTYTPDAASASVYKPATNSITVAIAATPAQAPNPIPGGAGFQATVSNVQIMLAIPNPSGSVISQAWATIVINGATFACTYQRSNLVTGTYSLACVTPPPVAAPPIPPAASKNYLIPAASPPVIGAVASVAQN